MTITIKKPVKNLTIFYNLIIFLVLVWFCNPVEGSAKSKEEWKDINMTDTVPYALFNVDAVSNDHYPPSNLFDADFNTCWVWGSDKSNNNALLFVRLPKLDRIRLNIFSGYGKNKKLYGRNARPEKLNLSVFVGINPQGYSSEIKTLYKAVEFPQKLSIQLSDHFGVQSFPLNFLKKELKAFRKKTLQHYTADFNLPIADTCLILKIEIPSFYPGTKYDDVCISEIFFNDSFVAHKTDIANNINKIYISKDENALLLDDNKNKGMVAYKDISSVLQLVEVAKNKRWAILISMPAKIQGRVETAYLLVDLVNRKMLNSQLIKYTGVDISGSAMYFEVDQYDRTYLIIDDEYKVQLR
ncbi:MAG: hypothetical protein GXP56_05005 [Deltaproteobacteria bacterium]|nr:hypothetical protein [Deltaproteobacteria bacterium]